MLITRLFIVTRNEGVCVLLRYCANVLHYGPQSMLAQRIDQDAYTRWMQTTERSLFDPLERIPAQRAALKRRPVISVVVPVYATSLDVLKQTISSVQNQSYPHWELCISDDASPSDDARRFLHALEGTDERIRITFGEKNAHIVAATNAALTLATGAYIGFLDHDDLLSPHALHEVARAINAHPELEYLYSDEDKIDADGVRMHPFFKPDWSPDLLLSMMYTGHFSVFRASALRRVGGLREGYEGAQDYDLVLRVTEQLPARHIHHIPKILYHWRSTATSTARGSFVKQYADHHAQQALNAYLQRNAINGKVVRGFFPGRYRIQRTIQERPLVSVLIPHIGSEALRDRLVRQITRNTSYPSIEIVAARQRPRGPYLLFLHPDVHINSRRWLEPLIEQIQRPEIGVVGPKLLLPNGRVDDCGLAVSRARDGIAQKLFHEEQSFTQGYLNFASIIRNCRAISSTCLLTRTELFEKIGGGNTDQLFQPFGELNYCLALQSHGYRILWTPHSVLTHDPDCAPAWTADRQAFILNTWRQELKADPYYSPYFSQNQANFSL